MKDPATAWQRLRLEEEGGFAGLRRGVELPCASLTAQQQARVQVLLQALHAGVATTPRAAGAMPDAQSLTLTVQLPTGAWTQCFDTADLPPEAAELLRLLPPLGPLPPR